MTRCDIEEVIVDLEYLLEINHSDAQKREEYEQQLRAFRLLLAAARQQDSSNSSGNGKRDWDAEIALLYAEEELFLTAQALIARDLTAAHRHLRRLLQHEHALPAEIGKCLRSLDATCSRLENTAATDEVAAHSLATATIALLDAVRRAWRNAAPLNVPGIAPYLPPRGKRTA